MQSTLSFGAFYVSYLLKNNLTPSFQILFLRLAVYRAVSRCEKIRAILRVWVYGAAGLYCRGKKSQIILLGVCN